MTELEALVERARRAFAATDPARDNGREAWPAVDIVDAEIVEDTPTFLLITPHALEGVAFPPDGRLGDRIDIGDYPHRVSAHETVGIGRYVTVELLENVQRLPSPAHARKTARQLGRTFRDGVAKARRVLRGAGAPVLIGT